MKLKNLRKKIRRLEKRLRDGPKKLTKLRRKLEAMEAETWLKAARRSVARATAARPAAKPSTSVEKKSVAQAAGEKPGSVKEAKKKLNLSPERRAQLAAAMRARWAAKRAAATPEAARRIEPSDEEIHLRAYFISEHRRRFALPGDAESDWCQAKQQLLSELGELSER
jgi:hypothetical protein